MQNQAKMLIKSLQIDAYRCIRISLTFDRNNEPIEVEVSVEAHPNNNSSNSKTSPRLPRYFVRFPLRHCSGLVDGMKLARKRSRELSIVQR